MCYFVDLCTSVEKTSDQFQNIDVIDTKFIPNQVSQSNAGWYIGTVVTSRPLQTRCAQISRDKYPLTLCSGNRGSVSATPKLRNEEALELRHSFTSVEESVDLVYLRPLASDAVTL